MIRRNPKESSTNELGFKAADGARLFAVEEGTGSTIVMIHGPMADHRASLPLVAPLSGRFRVIAPDVRASGRSRWARPLSFDLLADDVEALLDRLGSERAVVGGVSGGSGIAVRFALGRPSRVAGLVVVRPVYGGEAAGLTPAQQAAFAAMEAAASRAVAEGIAALRPLYAGLPDGVREKALAMVETFDPESVAATARFVASGAQPFARARDLESLTMPTLVVAGNDPLHPAEVSRLYADRIPGAVVEPATADVAAAIASFVG